MTAVWISFAIVLGNVAWHVGLPPLVGILMAGFILQAFGVQGGEILSQSAHAGVLLLVFSVGLMLRLKCLARPEVLAGSLLHMLITGLVMGAALHWAFLLPPGIAFFLAVSLAFSSTVVAAKVLEGKRELRAFHGRAAIGILVVQDIVAVAILGAMGGGPTTWAFAILALPLLRPVLHRFLEWSGHGELLVLYGLMLALVLGGAAFERMGLSPELGALLRGAMLAGHRRASELSGALWGLKDVFLGGFFLQIGMTGLPSWEGMQVALILAVVLPLKALLFFLILVLFRLRARSSFLAALSLATYSEFGLIVANLAVTRGWLTMDWLVILAVTVTKTNKNTTPHKQNTHKQNHHKTTKHERVESR